jgi:hypothetical protein
MEGKDGDEGGDEDEDDQRTREERLTIMKRRWSEAR